MSSNGECTKENMDNLPLSPSCEKAKANCEYPYEEICMTTKQQSGGLLFAIALGVIVFSVTLFTFIRNLMNSNTFKEAIVDKLSKFFKDNKITANVTKFDLLWQLVLVVLYTMLVAAVLIIIIAAYDIKYSYELGANFEKHCNNIFMEKERADFHVYSCYNNLYDYSNSDIEPAIFSNKRGGVKERLKTAYERLLVNIITIILLITIVLVAASFCIIIQNTEDSIKKIKKFFIGFLCLLFISLITMFSLWIRGNYKTDNDAPGSLINPYKDTLYEYKIELYWNKENIKNIVLSHITYIVLIFITVISSLYLIHYMFTYEDTEYTYEIKISPTFIWGIAILLIMLLLIIPLFITSARAFEINISHTYKGATENLKTFIEKYKSENPLKWSRIRKELEHNITADNRSKLKGELFERVNLSDPTTYITYQPHLFAYLTHIVNKSNIVGIPIPQELKPIIKPEYLGGELSIELKEAFITAYHKYVYNKYSPKITKESLSDDAYKHLKKYLKNDVLIKINDGKGEKELQLLNNIILISDNFNKGNPFPENIINELEKMRKDMTIKNTVDDYFSKINVITSIILIFIAYYIYHNIYPNDVDIKIQYVSMFIFILIMILGLVGWWMKELWL